MAARRKPKRKRVPLSAAAKQARRERRLKIDRKADTKRRVLLKKSGGVKSTHHMTAETKARLKELARTSGLTQDQVLAAAIQHITTRDVVNLNPPRPFAVAKIAAVKERIKSIGAQA